MDDPNNAVRDVLERLVRERGELGLQVAAYLDGDLVVDAWAGLADQASGRRVDGDTLFTGFSASKGVAATCVHMLADWGLLDYDDPIAKYWPEYVAHGNELTTVGHVLTHRTGIPQDPPGFDLRMMGDWDAVTRAVAALPPQWEPGTRVSYAPLTYGWILGEVLRRVCGRSIAEFLQDAVCAPLGISGLFFGVPPNVDHSFATLANGAGSTELAAQYGLLPEHPLRDPAGSFNSVEARHAVIPGAGALLNARSLARLYAMLAGGGELDGVRLLSPERVATASRPQPEEGTGVRWWSGHAFGFTLGGGPGPRAGRPRAFGYEGVGTIGFADPAQRYSFAFLKNLLDWICPRTRCTPRRSLPVPWKTPLALALARPARAKRAVTPPTAAASPAPVPHRSPSASTAGT